MFQPAIVPAKPRLGLQVIATTSAASASIARFSVLAEPQRLRFETTGDFRTDLNGVIMWTIPLHRTVPMNCCNGIA
jgi:hypothetical protein